MNVDGDETAETIEVVSQRIGFLELLDGAGTMETRTVVDQFECSRSTVTRALRELRETGLVKRTDEGYTATAAGALAAEEYRRHETTIEALITSKDLLATVPATSTPPAELFTGALQYVPDDTAPFRPIEAVSERIRNADSVQVYLPTLVNPHLLRVLHGRVAGDGLDARTFFDPELLTVMKGQYPGILSELADSPGSSVVTVADHPYAVLLTTSGDSTSVSVVLYEDETAVRGAVINDSEESVRWAQRVFDRLERAATDATDELRALDATVTRTDRSAQARTRSGQSLERATPRDPSLPIDLQVEGFVRLSDASFDASESAPPVVGWRTGFTFPEIRNGYAVDRTFDDGQRVTAALIDGLEEGNDHVVVGGPGTGKSTICMAVACEWYERRHGPVLYRQRGKGEEFTSSSLLEASLRQANGHALVVVEDAVRPESNAIFEVMQAARGWDDVTFLLDAREQEWDDGSPGGVGDRGGPYRRGSLERITVPDLDRDDCDRFVDRFLDLVDADIQIDLDETKLPTILEDETTIGDSGAPSPGVPLLIQHELAARVDPLVPADVPSRTGLEAEVQHVLRHVEDTGPLTTDLAVCVALLNAAGIPVAAEYLYALADPAEFDDLEAALSTLDGRLLFGRNQTGVPGQYRTHHESWSRRFLEQYLEAVPVERARDTFGRCVTRVLSLADDPHRRQRIERRLDERTPYLHQIRDDPQGWADEVLERVFALGMAHSSLTPLYGETGDGTIALPEACSTVSEYRQSYWRGQMYYSRGEIERAERASNRLCSLDESRVDLTDEELRNVRLAGLVGRGRLKAYQGENGEALETFQRALDIARDLDDDSNRVDVLSSISHLRYTQGEVDSARSYAETALELARENDYDRLEASVLTTLGKLHNREGNRSQAEQYYGEALGIVEENGGNPASMLISLGVLAAERNNIEDSRKYNLRALDLAREHGNRRRELIVLLNSSSTECWAGNTATAKDYARQAVDLAREAGSDRTLAGALSSLALVEYNRGELDAAEEHAREATDHADSPEHVNMIEDAFTMLSRVRLRQGNVEDAIDHVERAREINDAIESTEGLARCDKIRAQIEYERDNYDDAVAFATSALTASRELDTLHYEADVLRVLGLVAVERNAFGTAKERLEESLETARDSGVVPKIARGHEAVARRLTAVGEYEMARDHLTQALETYEQLTDSRRTFAVTRQLATVCDAADDDQTASEWRDRAVELAEQYDLPTRRELEII